jgi:hypothetical protein
VKKLLKWTLYGVLGFIGMIIAIGVIAAVVAPPAPQGSDPAPQQVPQQDQQPEPAQDNPAPEEPSGPEDFLHVTGTEGIPFSCAVMDGDMSQRTVDGVVPQKIELKEMGWTATSENSCQKSGTEGVLKVAIVVGGDVQDTNSTSAEYGIASVGYPR